MRLFIAIQCPEEIESILRNCQKDLENDYAEIRFADSFHITLKFLGEVDEKNIPLIKEALSKIRQKKFRVSLCGLGAFPNMSHPNVLWTGITPSEEVYSLQRNVNSCLPAKMTFAKNEDFHPHITLCRIKTVYDKEKFESSINKIKSHFPLAAYSSINHQRNTQVENENGKSDRDRRASLSDFFDIPESSFEADRFILYQSFLEKNKTAYMMLEEFMLE